MATHKSTQAAPDGAIENLLADIASTAYFTELRLRASPGREESAVYELVALRDVVAKMGWMADAALQRLGSVHCMQDGTAEAWLLSPICAASFAQEVQS